jgi:hypothetical protein
MFILLFYYLVYDQGICKENKDVSDITKPNAIILKIVESKYRNDKDVSKEQAEEIALLMTRSLADPQIRKTVESIAELDRKKNELKDKYRNDGYSVHTTFVGGDLGELTKVVLKKDDKTIEMGAEEFASLKSIYDKRASQVKGLHMEVLRIAAKDDLSSKSALRAGGILYGMSCGGEISRELLDSIEKQSGGQENPSNSTNLSVDENMQRALIAFGQMKGEDPAGASPGSLGAARPQRNPDVDGRS